MNRRLFSRLNAPGNRHIAGRVFCGAVSYPSAFLALFVLAALAVAEEVAPGSFELTVNPEKHVSLTANDAPLEAIVAELGAQLGIEVSGSLSDDMRVTAQLTDVTVSEALGQIGDSYVLISDAEDGQAQRIILLGKGQDGRILDDPESGLQVDPNSDAPQGGFQFEFDPSSAPVQEKAPEQPDSSRDRQ